MATVTGLTKERMLEIEAASIINGAVDLSGHLILTNFAGDDIDAGYVKGDPGDPFSVPNRLESGGMEVSDWNLAVESGFYWSQSTALNNPIGNVAVGYVLVKPTGPNARIFQEVHFPSTNTESRTTTYRRVSTDGGTTWSSWGSNLPGRLASDLPNLGEGVDLDTVLASGRYIQRASANASTGLNYPIPSAGFLEVSASNQGSVWMVLQTYTMYTNTAIYQRNYYSGWSAWKRIDPYLPAPVYRNYTTAVNTVSASAFAACPGISTVSMTFTSPTWVSLSMGGWLSAPTGDLRSGIAVSGATVIAANEPAEGAGVGAASWGSIMWAANVYEQRSATKMVLCNAGTNTFTLMAYSTGTGTRSMNYPNFIVNPIRYA